MEIYYSQNSSQKLLLVYSYGQSDYRQPKPGQTPLSMTVYCFLCSVHQKTYGTYGFTSQLKDEAIMVKYFATGHTYQDSDSN